MQIELRTLYTFTVMHVDGAREMARHGQKDEARNRLRFIRNASIIKLLKHFENNGSVFDIDVSHLEWKLRELENDCHPSSSPDLSDDFTRILYSLETIAVGVNQLLSKNAAKTDVY